MWSELFPGLVQVVGDEDGCGQVGWWQHAVAGLAADRDGYGTVRRFKFGTAALREEVETVTTRALRGGDTATAPRDPGATGGDWCRGRVDVSTLVFERFARLGAQQHRQLFFCEPAPAAEVDAEVRLPRRTRAGPRTLQIVGDGRNCAVLPARVQFQPSPTRIAHRPGITSSIRAINAWRGRLPAPVHLHTMTSRTPRDADTAVTNTAASQSTGLAFHAPEQYGRRSFATNGGGA